MRTSGLLSNLSTLSFFASAASFVMIFISAAFYLPMDRWLIMTGANWFFCSLALLAIGLVLMLVSNSARKAEKVADEKERDQRNREAALRADAESYKRNQEAMFSSVNLANSNASKALYRLSTHLQEAESFLRQADIDWNERVYNPFWTSLEGAALKLKAFDDDVSYINSMASQYKNSADSYEGVVPPFAVTEISVSAMNSYKTLIEKLSKTTRVGLSEPTFASIYEQWQGNRIMAAGFSDLRSAISDMSVSIAGRLSSLQAAVDGVSSGVNVLSGTISDQTSMLSGHAELAQAQNAELIRSARESSRLEKEAVKRLRHIDKSPF